MRFVKPNRLKVGDTVAALSPSWGGPSLYPHVFDLGLRNLEQKFGLKIKEFPTARMDNETIYRNPKLRADDLNRAFEDPEVTAILASIGGDDSVRILPFLDLDLIKANPKILMGFSDSATFLTFLNTQGLVTYNGPSIMAGFAQMEHLDKAFETHVRELLFESPETYDFRPYSTWSDRYAPWSTPGYKGEVEAVFANDEGWRWLQGTSVARGRLFGGCIEVLEFLKGTRFWPTLDFFNDVVMFFETSEDKPSVSNVMYMLRNYGSMGVLERAAGLMFGRARSYSPLEKAELDNILVRTVSEEFGRPDMPIVSNLDFGHTEPQWVMPLGIGTEVDCQSRTIRLSESPTS